MASASKIRSLSLPKLLDLFNSPPGFKEDTLEADLLIEMLVIYNRYCNDTFDKTTHEDRVNNPRKHTADFIRELFEGKFGGVTNG